MNITFMHLFHFAVTSAYSNAQDMFTHMHTDSQWFKTPQHIYDNIPLGEMCM